MSIKIYLPAEYFYLKRSLNLYGHVQINEDDVITYFVVEASQDDPHSMHPSSSSNFRFLGCIRNAEAFAGEHHLDMRLCFTYSQARDSLCLVYVGITPENLQHAKIILYQRNFRNLSENGPRNDQDCNFWELSKMLHLPEAKAANQQTNLAISLFNIFIFIASLPIAIFQLFVENILVHSLMVHTTIYKHFTEWKLTFNKGFRPINIVLDRVMGLIFMVILFSWTTQPGDFLIQISHSIIGQLYSLLNVLEDSPIGLKLNIHLNNFFVDCFKYHIELWSTFLDFIEPFVRQVYLAIGVFGTLGFTFQIALLADLISVIGLHSHCFYIYTKVLYNVERKGLSVLWQVVRGNRYNILKGKIFNILGRIEAHNYMNRQLYLATIIFSSILFLYPTIFVYYVVFAVLKALTSATLIIFEYFRRNFLYVPIEGCLKWFIEGSGEIDCLKITNIFPQEEAFFINKHHRVGVSVYKIET
ncbi:hypothetical protein KR018_008965 [Drosophila ironensis]|nr:hypothetical protein KR018_008965 [Drosophila ironensis]